MLTRNWFSRSLGADADKTERMRAEVSALCAGWDVAQVSAIVRETLHDVVDPLVYVEATDLIAQHLADGHDVIVLSATGEEVAAPVAEMLGATRCVATRMEIVDGRYSGEVDFYCYGENKAVAAKQQAATHGYDLADCFAYTDSSTDIPLLEVVGHPHAVNPDKLLRRTADEHGWPVLAFERPMSLRTRIPAKSAGMVALGVGAVAAGATWYSLVAPPVPRHRRLSTRTAVPILRFPQLGPLLRVVLSPDRASVPVHPYAHLK